MAHNKDMLRDEERITKLIKKILKMNLENRSKTYQSN